MVELRTDDGLVGYGEALARSSLRSFVSLIEDLLAPIVVGQDPFEVERLWQKMLRVFTGKTGGIFLAAVAAVDIAIWDIMGKAVGQPIHRLLGSTGLNRIPVYASSVSWASDETAIAQTEAAVRRGFSMIKIKIGPPVEKAVARAKLIRKVAGDAVQLCADGNCAFDFDDTLRLAHSLSDLDYFWLEEPMNIEDIDGYHRLRRKMPFYSPQAKASTPFTAAAISSPTGQWASFSPMCPGRRDHGRRAGSPLSPMRSTCRSRRMSAFRVRSVSLPACSFVRPRRTSWPSNA